jgi:hypothetical protein
MKRLLNFKSFLLESFDIHLEEIKDFFEDYDFIQVEKLSPEDIENLQFRISRSPSPHDRFLKLWCDSHTNLKSYIDHKISEKWYSQFTNLFTNNPPYDDQCLRVDIRLLKKLGLQKTTEILKECTLRIREGYDMDVFFEVVGYEISPESWKLKLLLFNKV